MESNRYFRPTWTCGRYDAGTKSAIMYNLIAGYSFFFEDYSADVIGAILSCSRGEELSVSEISLQTNIDSNSVESFLSLLTNYHLVSNLPMNEDVIASYRKEVVVNRKNDKYVSPAKYNEDPEPAKAERNYADRCGSRVVSVMLELTYDCSERCIHCYNPGATRNNEEKAERHKFCKLSKEDYIRVIDECYNEGMVKMCLTGGDPFSNPFAWDIIKYLYEKDIAIEIFTNGQSLVGKEKLLASYFPCDVGLSVYSAEAKVHDSITRVPGSWKKTMTVMEKLSNLGVPLELKCCIMRPNLKTYYPLIEVAEKYNAFLQLQSSVFDSMDGDKCVSKNLLLTPEEMEIALSDRNNPLYVGASAENYGEEKHSLKDVGCHTGNGTFCITPTGDVVLCSCFDASLGNVRKQSMSEILESEQLKKWRKLTLESFEECARHDYCSFCQICPGLNFAENGTPLKASKNNCYVAKIRFNMAQKLKKGTDPLHGKSLEEALDNLPEYKWHTLAKENSLDSYGNSLNL